MIKWLREVFRVIPQPVEEEVDIYSPPVNNILRAINNRWHTFCLLGRTERESVSYNCWSGKEKNYFYKDTKTGVVFDVTRKWTDPAYWCKEDRSDRHSWSVSCNACHIDWDESKAIGQEIGKRIMARLDNIQNMHSAKEHKKWVHKQKLNEIKRNHVVDLYAGEK